LVEHKASLSLAPYYHCRVLELLAPYPADPAKHPSTISASRKGGTTYVVRSICEKSLTRLARFRRILSTVLSLVRQGRIVLTVQVIQRFIAA
jgi:hypothetical protein